LLLTWEKQTDVPTTPHNMRDPPTPPDHYGRISKCRRPAAFAQTVPRLLCQGNTEKPQNPPYKQSFTILR
jgi:hypothetical protein